MKPALMSPGRGEDISVELRFLVRLRTADCGSTTPQSAIRDQVAVRNARLENLVVLLDLLHDVEPFRDAAEDGVNAIKVLRALLAEHHGELAAASVLAGVRHRQGADDVLLVAALGLALDGPPRTTGADGPFGVLAAFRVGIAALDDEVGYDAMELRPIVEPAVGELLEVRHRARGVLVVQLRGDGAAVRFDGRSLWHGWKYSRVAWLGKKIADCGLQTKGVARVVICNPQSAVRNRPT